MDPELVELQEESSGRLPNTLQGAAALLLGVLLTAWVVGTMGLLDSSDQGAARLFDAGFADGSRTGAGELASRLDRARSTAYREAVRRAMENGPSGETSGAWLRASIPEVNAAILAAGSASPLFQRGYQDGLRQGASERGVE